MRLIVLLIILVILGCAMLASNAHKPFDLRIDAQSPGVWPTYAEAQRMPVMPQIVVCYPMITTRHDQPKRISRT